MAFLARHANVSPAEYEEMDYRDTLALAKHTDKLVELEVWKQFEMTMTALGARPR